MPRFTQNRHLVCAESGKSQDPSMRNDRHPHPETRSLVQRQRSLLRPLTTLLLAFVAVGQLVPGCKRPAAPNPAPPATTQQTATSAPATTPATTRATIDFIGVVAEAYPTLSATRPLDTTLSLHDAARYTLATPICLDLQGCLWITHPRGQPAEDAIRDVRASKTTEAVLRDRVLFAWWIWDRGAEPWPALVVAGDAPDGGGTPAAPALVLPTGRTPIGSRHDYQWQRARTWTDRSGKGQPLQRMIVPTTGGCSMFSYAAGTPIAEQFVDLRGPAQPQTQPASEPSDRTEPPPAVISPPASATSPSESLPPPEPLVQFVFDSRGVIAWVPATPSRLGSNGAARFVEGNWLQLTPEHGWPNRILHLIPLRDGSVTQILQKPADAGGGVELATASVDAPNLDARKVLALVEQLSAVDPADRDKAYAELVQYGPGIGPILRGVDPQTLPPEGQIRLEQLAQSQLQPMIGGMALAGDQLRIAARLPEGGVVFYSDQGVSVPGRRGDAPETVAPAWVAALPGRPVSLLNSAMTPLLVPGKTLLQQGGDQWVVVPPGGVPRQFLGNSFRKLLRESQRDFKYLLGIDRQGRWLFRKAPSLDGREPGETLLIDPTLPDLEPRLPVWLYANADEAGWTKDNWPAVSLGELHMKLSEEQWEPIDNLGVITELPATAPSASDIPEAVATQTAAGASQPAMEHATTWPAVPKSIDSGPSGAVTQPATQSTSRPTSPTTLAANAHLGPLLLRDAAGRRYYGGSETLTVVSPDGSSQAWPLPPTAVGSAPATLLQAPDGKLFLFNQPGRVIRLKTTEDAANPLKLEATFTKDIPADDALRIWLDPAGRIIMALHRRLAILFPQGFVPTAIQRMMDTPEDELDE